MNTSTPTPLLGGLSPDLFMRRHWQKKPLLIRQAMPHATQAWLTRAKLFALAAQDDVESRLIVRGSDCEAGWTLRHGPLARRALPPLQQPGWTVLVQGVDLCVDAAHELLARFRFVPDARMDDLMVSWASDGGGVGPHRDSYDVFLLQAQGRRRWRIAPPGDNRLVPDVPLRILSHFTPTEEYVLDEGDMLYLPPGWAHDGVAEGECMTASIGFRVPARTGLAREVMQRVLDAVDCPEGDPLYRDRGEAATATPGRIPQALQNFSADAVARLLRDPRELACALGEVMSEPKPHVWFSASEPLAAGDAVRLDRRTRMVYDDHHVFINGESFRAGGSDARVMRRLSDQRELRAEEMARLSADASELLQQWACAGWLHAWHT